MTAEQALLIIGGRLWRSLFGPADLGYVEHWTPARAERAERWTHRYLGIRPETHHTWSRKYRPKQGKPLRIAERKSA